jgi:hypothetical protein
MGYARGRHDHGRVNYRVLHTGGENGVRLRESCLITCKRHLAIARFIVAPGGRGWCTDHGSDDKGVTWLRLLSKPDGKLGGAA